MECAETCGESLGFSLEVEALQEPVVGWRTNNLLALSFYGVSVSYYSNVCYQRLGFHF